MSDKGFIKLSRKLFDNKIWQAARAFNECEAWIDLIQSARFEASSTTSRIGCYEVTWGRGQYPASNRFLAKKWGRSEQWVKSLLGKLKREKMITTDNSQGVNVITLINFEKYNGEVVDNPPSNPPNKLNDRELQGLITHLVTHLHKNDGILQPTSNPNNKKEEINKENSINRVKEKMGYDFGSCDIGLSELQHELSADSGWEEAIRLHLYRNGIKVFDHDMFLLWLDKFVISLKAGGTISKDRKGFMEHFRNWILTEIKRGATNLFKDTNDALLKSSECNKTYHKFLSYIKKQAPYCFSNMRLPTEEEFLLLRDKYGNDMFKSALCTIEGRVDIRSKWDVLYNAVLKQFEFMKDER